MAKAAKPAAGSDKKTDKASAGSKKKPASKKTTAKQAAAPGKLAKPAASKSAVGNKTATQKTAPKKAAAKKAVAKQASTGKKGAASARSKPASASITWAERYDLIKEAAYLLSERKGFRGDPCQDWLEAEREVDGQLQAAGTSVKG